MNRIKNVLFCILITGLCANTVHAQPQDDSPASVIELTPEQFEESLSMDKAELEMDHALQLDLRSEIEASAVPYPVAATTQEQAASTVQPSPSTTAPSNADAPATGTPYIKQITTKPTNAAPGLRAAGLDNDASIEFQFEDADLEILVKQVGELFDIQFLTDDMISPLPAGGKSIKGNKISFKTHVPLTKTQAWNLFITFLDIAGFAIVPDENRKLLRIVSTPAARTSPIPAFLGVKPDTLPDSDQLVRYLYFLENSSLDTINNIINSLRSSASSFIVLKDLNAFVLTDKAENIKSLMSIVTELDRVTLPQSMSVLKLKRADALDVKKLYDSIVPTDENALARMPVRKQSTSLYFPENTRIIAEARTNSLILLGPLDAIKKIEDFIIRYVDVELGEETLSPLRVYPLKYADAKAVAEIMNQVSQFGKNTTAGKVGGVRDGDKYIKSLTFFAEPDTNRLIIKGDEEDYLQAKAIIERLDEPQPQIALEVLIITVDLNSTKALGTQLRTREPSITDGLVGNKVKFQTSGIDIQGATQDGIITRPTGPGVERLLGNLITLVSGASAGNTVVTFGSDIYGVWGIFNAIQTISNAEVVANPFLTTTNKQLAKVSIGEERRVVSGQTVNSLGGTTNSFASDKASLDVIVTPQINSDGMIVLDLDININDFTNPTIQTDAEKNIRQVKTTTIVADKEVLAVGGLIKNKVDTFISKVPILGDIPLFGWLFKTKSKIETKDNLLILISTHIIPPGVPQAMTSYTQERIRDYHGTLDQLHEVAEKRDPIHRFFFADKPNTTDQAIDDFIFERQKPKRVAKNVRRKRRAKQQSVETPPVAAPENLTPASTATIAQHKGQEAGRRKSLITLIDAQQTGQAS